jgi:hypothetical protein
LCFRFLRARKFDVVKGKEMLLNAEKWRKDFGVEDVVKYVFFLLFFLTCVFFFLGGGGFLSENPE